MKRSYSNAVSKRAIFFLLICCSFACGKGGAGADSDTTIDEPMITGQNSNGHDFSFNAKLSATDGTSKDFDVDQDGVNDIRFTEQIIAPTLPANQQQAYNTYQFQQKFDVTILNSKLSLAVTSQKTNFIYEVSDADHTSTMVIDRPSLANIDPKVTKVDGKLDFSSQTNNSLLYVGQFIYAPTKYTLLVPKWPQSTIGNNFLYTDVYAPDIVSGLSNLEPFGKGYIGFKLLDANNQPKYGWIAVDIFNDQWVYGNLSFQRWYQLSVLVYQIGIGNKPNMAIQPGCPNYDGCNL